MRLLNTTTIELHEFHGSAIPPYSILSHRWEGDEISFQDVLNKKRLDAQGWVKVRKCCDFAKLRGHEFVWVDTCCIDKTSSAELTEAINSMFAWYQRAHTCYAYLSDVPSGLEDQRAQEAAISKSKWFTRGWTLQELLAPSHVVFLSNDWNEVLGTKSSLSHVISFATGIRNVSKIKIFQVSVATRMNWASRRVCTREEDTAYCLMGIFGVHMPLLYGEGRNAFIRLQLEILKNSADESIFAWFPSDTRFTTKQGMLAASPKDFENSRGIMTCVFDRSRPPISMTNKGLQFNPILIPNPYIINEDTKQTFIVPLNCSYSTLKCQIVITLAQSRLSADVFTRVCLDAEMTAQFRYHQRIQEEKDLKGPSRSSRLGWMDRLGNLGERRLVYVRQPGFPPDPSQI
jgi:hypothetical protein